MRPTSLIVLLLAQGCASIPHVPTSEVVRRYDENPVAAYLDYRGKTLTVSGTVAQIRLVPRESMKIHESGTVVGPLLSSSSHVSVERDDVAAVTLQPEGRVLCYFEPNELDDVSKMKVGQTLTTTCQFLQYQGEARHAVAVFGYCHPPTGD
jgi:hypothetical protein